MNLKIHVAPNILYDIDGWPMALRQDLAETPAKALRFVIEEHDWLLEDAPCVPIKEFFEDEGKWEEGDLIMRPQLSWYRAWRDEVKIQHWRPFNEELDAEFGSDFGEDAWFRCAEDYELAIPYWEIGQ